MNSCIYKLKIGHSRIFPKKNNFRHDMYMFYFDLDELSECDKKFKLFSYNKWNIHSFYDKDHFTFINPKSESEKIISQEKIKFQPEKYQNKNTKERIKIILKEINQDFELGKVFLLTSLRNYGYLFNPVSFYYCFDKQGNFRVLFSEVSNTWRQQKMYYYVAKDFNAKIYKTSQVKNFYISPFIKNDIDLNWHFEIPGKKILMLIKSSKQGKLELSASLVGKRAEITNFNLVYILFRYPLVTIMVIFKIHWQALKLWLKGVKYINKNEADKNTVNRIIKRTD